MSSKTHEPWIVDFGIAKELVQTKKGGNTLIGTPAFQGPEIAEGIIGPYSDIFSLGSTVLCLTNLLSDDDCDWEDVLPKCSFFGEGMKNILKKMISSDFTQRYQNCDDVIKDLNKLNASVDASPGWAPADKALFDIWNT